MGEEIATKRIKGDWVKRTEKLEKNIDALDALNVPLKNFILPGGSKITAYLHLARSICRRAERWFWHWLRNENKGSKKLEKEFQYIGSFLNRLSDYFFVLARKYNNQGEKDILWIPHKGM